MRYSAHFDTIMSQWLDMWSNKDRDEREGMQKIVLRESAAMLRRAIEDEGREGREGEKGRSRRTSNYYRRHQLRLCHYYLYYAVQVIQTW